jgi:predicted porin
MKKSLLALAVLGAYAGVASAQSSVTMYGTLDMAGTYVKNDGTAKRLSLSTNGVNSSQLGFRGVEDLGGGLKAGFNLIAELARSDTGSVGNATGDKFFSRRSTVSLFTNAGELRLGRDYTPTFWNLTIFDAFGTNGVGSTLNPRQLYQGTRQDNSIGYFLPSNIGGFYGQLMTAAGEGGTSGDKPGTYVGGRLGFAAGPFDVAVAYGELKYDLATNVTGTTGSGQLVPVLPGQKQKIGNIGGSWDFGFFKLLGYYDHEKVPNAKEDFWSISANFPFGQNEFRFGYDESKLDRAGSNPDTKVKQFKATYGYNLSKRTLLYASASVLDNDNGTRLMVLGGSGQGNSIPAGTMTNGGKSKGAQFGVRHFF